MGYDYTDCLEIACMDKLHCDLDDLKALVPIYSDLSEQSGVSFKMLACMNDLHVMAEYSLTTIRNYIADNIRTIAKIDKYIELVPDDEDSGYVKYEIDDRLELDLRDLAKRIQNIKPVYTDLSDIKFNSIIDEAIDWETYECYP